MRHNWINTNKALDAIKYTFRHSRRLPNREKSRYVNRIKAAIMTVRPYMKRGEANDRLTTAIVDAAFKTIEKQIAAKCKALEIGRNKNE